MSSVRSGLACIAGMLLLVGVAGHAQKQAPAPTSDPRVGLKPGLRDAGQAARNLELVSSLPKPLGFFDPKQPAGEPTGPETEEKPEEKKPEAKPSEKQRGEAE